MRKVKGNAETFKNTLLTLTLLTVFSLLFVDASWARQPQNKVERFFDRDKNKKIDWYEQQLIITHSLYQWELANTSKKKLFDYNNDMMLTPYEYNKYLESKSQSKHKVLHPLININQR